MDQGNAIIIVSVISTVGAILVAILQQFRTENRKDHASVVQALQHLNKNVDKNYVKLAKVDLKLDKHLFDHEKENHGIVTTGNTE